MNEFDDPKQNILPEQWVSEFLNKNQISYDYKTDGYRQRGQVIEAKILIAKLRLAANKEGVQGINKYLNDALMLWRYENQHNVLSRIIDQLSHPSSTNEVKKWVRAATGKESELDVAVVAHFIWQVKRKLNGMPVDHHMMPILFGRSGGGKSVAIHKLIAPLKQIAFETNMSVFQDRFGLRQFTRNYIMFFDELSGASAVDVNRLKQVITSPVMEWRVMHSEGVNSAPQNCTFIGCTNIHVSERIKDPTSARRFWQITCADVLDWDLINEVNYEAMWCEVDHQADSPIIPFLSDIKSIQENEVRSKTLTEQWLEQCCVAGSFTRKSPTSKKIYEHFQEWCKWQGLRASYSFQQFSKELPTSIRTLDVDIQSKHSNRGTIWSLKLRTD